jgi:polysaccharide biosynthesis/export protein
MLINHIDGCFICVRHEMNTTKFVWLSGLVLMLFLISVSCSVQPRTTSDSPKNKSVAQVKHNTAKKGSATPSGAKQAKGEQSSKPAVVQASAVVMPEAASGAVQQKSEEKLPEYLLGYGDVLEIKFFNQPEYNEAVKVRPDGRITLQKVGDFYVVGKTPSELQRLVTSVYSEYLVNPDVTVFVRDFGGQECYVMGEVEKPGMVSITKGMTLLRAIAAAGGPKKNAKLNSIILMRAGENDKADVTRLNLSFSSVDDDGNVDKSVKAFDVIYVPRTFIADLDNFASQVWNIVLPPVDSWVRFRYWRDWNNN